MLKISGHPAELFQLHRLGRKSFRAGLMVVNGPKKGMKAFGKGGTGSAALDNAMSALRRKDLFGKFEKQ